MLNHYRPKFGLGNAWLALLVLAAVAFAPAAPSGQSQPTDDSNPSKPNTAQVVTGFARGGGIDMSQVPITLEPSAAWMTVDRPIERPSRSWPPRTGQSGAVAEGMDPLVSVQLAPQPLAPWQFNTFILNHPGQGYTGVNPPDASGDVGFDHYVQAVNSPSGARVTVFDKRSGAVLGGFYMKDLFVNFGGGCLTNPIGNPVVLFDPFDNRFLVVQTASTKAICTALLPSPNPLSGTAWVTGNIFGIQPDHVKVALGENAFYFSSNEPSPRLFAYHGFEMVNQISPVPYDQVTVPPLAGFSVQALTPVDIDGPTAQPAGTGGLYLRHVDDEAHNPPGTANDFIEVWQYLPQYSHPPASGIIKIANINIAEFSSNLCGLTGTSCFGQPGTATKLDPVREAVMFRASYRNFGTHESIVGNFVVDANGADKGGIRWFELRRTGAGLWLKHQEGTYSPDSLNRWIGGIAMDYLGDIAMAYNVGNATTFAGLRYTARLAGDPLGQMTQPEDTIVDGTSASPTSLWGSYGSMSIDPENECTFYHTGPYADGGQWETRISAFKFPNCNSTPEADLEVIKIVDNPTPVVGSNVTFTIGVYNNGPYEAAYVTIKDVLPAGLTFVSAAATFGAYNSATGIWDNPSIPVGVTDTLDIVATVISTGNKTNKAQIWDSQTVDPDSIPGNSNAAEDDQDSVTITPVVPADLSVTKAVNNPTPAVGSNVTFTVTVSNGGSGQATGVSVKDQLPAGLTFVSATPSQGTYNSGTGVWTVGTIANAASKTLSLVATAATAGAKTNTAQVTASNQPDPDSTPNNNNASEDDQASATVTPVAGATADLSLTKIVSNATPTVGSNVTFTIAVANGGPAQATGVSVLDLLPSGLAFVSATPSQGTYTSATGVWAVGTIANAASKTLSLVATVSTAGAKTNTAQVSASGQADPDSTPNNNNASEDDQASVTVTPGAAGAPVNLIVSAVTTTPTKTAAAANQSITVNATTKNSGTGTAGSTITKVYLSSNGTLGAGDVLLGQYPAIASLGPSASVVQSLGFIIPAGTATGKWYVLAQADGGTTQAETSETDNVKNKVIYVGPDLYISKLTRSPSSAQASTNVTITVWTKNQVGAATAGASTTKVFYSENGTLDAGDTLLITRAVAALAGGADDHLAAPANYSVTIPGTATPGARFLIAVADHGGVVVESLDGLKNIKKVGITINP